MKNALLYTALSLAMLPLIACQSVNSVERSDSVAERQMVNDKRVITDGGLGRHIDIVGVNESESEAGYLKIQVELRNNTRSRRPVQYLFEWFDENGNLVSSPSGGFQTRVIEGGESVFLTNVAPTNRAKDFRLKLLEADR